MGEPGAQAGGNAVELGAHGVQQALLLAGAFVGRDREQRLLLAEQSLDSSEDLELFWKRR
jgi:hypothetical protein